MVREISLPFRLDGTGGIASTDDLAEQIQHHVLVAVGTQRGERMMDGAYGADLLSHLFGGIDTLMVNELEAEIARSIRDNVPEATFAGVDVTTDADNGSVELTVHYKLANGVDQTAVIPTKLPTS